MFDWSDEKDAALRKERGIGFQDVVFHIEQGDVLAIVDHPNTEKCPNQKIIYIRIEDYVYLVPFVESEEGRFLKTIIPSRKATKRYLEEER
jgi:uncharacterized DUF497 family protein